MSADRTLVASVVGIDGCGKSSAFKGALELMAPRLDVVGIGDEVLDLNPVELERYGSVLETSDLQEMVDEVGLSSGITLGDFDEFSFEFVETRSQGQGRASG